MESGDDEQPGHIKAKRIELEFTYESKLHGYHNHLTIFDNHSLAVRTKVGRTRTRDYKVNLRFVDPVPQTIVDTDTRIDGDIRFVGVTSFRTLVSSGS